MKISSIKFENYRIFENFECTLHPELTVFVATNGAGKTSILDGIRVMFDSYLGAFPTGTGRGIKTSDVRQINNGKNDVIRMETRYPARVTALGTLPHHSKLISWTHSLNTAKSRTTVKEARVIREYAHDLMLAQDTPNDTTAWPLLAYYGTGRLWSKKKLTFNKEFSAGYYSRAAGYIDCMDPASSHKSFNEWFGSAYRAATTAKIRFMESNPDISAQDIINFSSSRTPLLNAVREAVDTVLAPSGWKQMWYSETSTLDDSQSVS
jgi:predicted ATP-binding protein involved in virulence